ncbi:MAG: Rpn family recombination-promoting nuclease/putative transposase [Synergistaceae bacterium]|jgi:predicted transposase/invertase (TIGR01784 family)|nr:Rpn family recombination-promoting nuclease/putative transposase [Synergistaceae bacterium]
MESYRVNRKNDYAFKRIFGQEDTKDILARFLSLVLDVEIRPEELRLLNPALPSKYITGKSSVLDIMAEHSAAHEKLHIELQCVNEGNTERRAMYYWGRAFTEDLPVGGNYSALPRMISILILDFRLFKWRDQAKYHGVFHISDDEERVLFTDALEIHVIELPRLMKRKLDDGTDALVLWGMYLNNIRGSVMDMIARREPMIRRAMTVEEAFMQSAEERRLYDIRERTRLDWSNAISVAKQRGEKTGRKKGERVGLRKGRREGRLEGRLEIARKMLDGGASLDYVLNLTGLTREELAQGWHT